MKGQLTRDEDGDLWVYLARKPNGYWEFVGPDDQWPDVGVAHQLTGDTAKLFEAAPAMLAALKKAVTALNVKPKFRVGFTDSYAIAALCDKAIRQAEGGGE